MATPSPNRRDSPAHPCSAWFASASAWVGRLSAPRGAHRPSRRRGTGRTRASVRTPHRRRCRSGRRCRRRHRRRPSGRTPVAAVCHRRARVGRSRRSGGRVRVEGGPPVTFDGEQVGKPRVDPVGNAPKGRRWRPWHGAAETNGLRVRQRWRAVGGEPAPVESGCWQSGAVITSFGSGPTIDWIKFSRKRRRSKPAPLDLSRSDQEQPVERFTKLQCRPIAGDRSSRTRSVSWAGAGDGQWPDDRRLTGGGWRRQSGSVEAATVEVGGDLLDAQLGRRDLGPAQLDQFRRPGDPLGEVVDVDVGTLEFTQDAVEFGEGGGVAGLCGAAVLVAVVMLMALRSGW